MDEKETKKNLKFSIYDGAAFAVMDGMTFAVALNASVNLIAALSYIPQLLGAFAQLLSTRIAEIFRDRKKILVIGSFVHAIFWIPLLLIPYSTPNQKYLLVVYVAVQAIFVQIMLPVGNSFLGDIVPKYNRGKFFGLRNKIIGIISFVSALAAGLILAYFSPKNIFLGFAILFSLAFIGRVLSGIFKLFMDNPAQDFWHEEKFSLVDFVKRMDRTNYGHFVKYLTLFKFSTNIAAPFFTLYILRDLNFNYLQFTIIISSELIASFIAMGIWGRLIDEKGTKFVLYICGLLTPLIPLFWLFSGNFYYLIIVAAFSGVAWAGFNLSASNFIFDSVQPENRIRCISYHKFFEGIALFIGAILGGFLINHAPAWIFISSIPIVFLVSGILRLIASLILLPTLKEARLIEMGVGHSFFKRYITIRPSEGLVFEVIGKYRKHEDEQSHQKIMQNSQKQRAESNDKDIYKKKLLKYIDKNISPEKEQHEILDMHDIENITEEIEKGKIRK